MDIRRMVIILIGCLISTTAALYRPPHIVFLYCDDLGWNDVGWHNPVVYTPNLNRLAAQGVIMESVYSQPTCTPSRNSLMTGLYPSHTELQKAITSAEASYLPTKYKLLPQHLKELGYSTHLVGKWHLGFCNEKFLPTRRGFDSSYGILSGSCGHYMYQMGDNVPVSLNANISFNMWDDEVLKSVINVQALTFVHGRDFRFNDSVWKETQGIYSTHAYTKRAVEIIQRHDVRTPLFLYVPYQAPHSPIEVPKKYSQRFSHIREQVRRNYLGMVHAIDESVETITEALEDRGLMDNLLLVFTSDNGGHPYWGGSNWPLRGSKSSIWEGGTRVPTFVYSRTLLDRTNTTTRQMMHAVDWMPTLLEVAGKKPVHGVDGRSQWRMISRGQKSSRQEFLYDVDQKGKGAIRVGDYKLISGRPGFYNDWYLPQEVMSVPRTSYKGGKYDKHRLGSDVTLLFNIKDDPSESKDLSQELPEVTQALLRRLQHYNATKKAPMHTDKVSESNPDLYDGYWSPGWC